MRTRNPNAESVGEQLTAAELEIVLVKMAEIAVQYPQYLCLYERMEREMAKAIHHETVLERARRIAEAGKVDWEELSKCTWR